ncbi:hypothetical protein BJF83_22425 [Nocardiopsis sp. CNR-923]|uniref:hypothetical protein n=1 Tax=Nocardiopsis sp. CNR-923 TaxID=1904965 RepID=UPI00095BF460|nr:hypothetical protein [Nocardiopsis sp. CNR-923]OLT25840.1 hypothetical protein BJF83_22425 [Nocardiopsis sp. CNR-923]
MAVALSPNRIASRIPVARVIAAAKNPVSYVESVANACRVLGLEVIIAYTDHDDFQHAYKGAVELSAGIDLRWSDDLWTPGWTVTTPAGTVIDRPFRKDLYPLPLDVAQEALEEINHLRDQARQLDRARQNLAQALNTHLHTRYKAASLDDLGWCGNCRLDIDLDGYCDCDPTLVRFSKPINPS